MKKRNKTETLRQKLNKKLCYPGEIHDIFREEFPHFTENAVRVYVCNYLAGRYKNKKIDEKFFALCKKRRKFVDELTGMI